MKFNLEKNEIIVINPKIWSQRKTEIICNEGTLHITQTNDIKDYLISANESYSINKKGKILIRALKSSKLSFSSLSFANNKSNTLQKLIVKSGFFSKNKLLEIL